MVEIQELRVLWVSDADMGRSDADILGDVVVKF